METSESNTFTEKNLERLAALLHRDVGETASIVSQIPDGAHIFHGTRMDETLTQANLALASKILLGMTLGYVDEAPLVMIFETKTGEYQVLDLLDEAQRERAEAFVETFQSQNEQDMNDTLKKQLTA